MKKAWWIIKAFLAIFIFKDYHWKCGTKMITPFEPYCITPVCPKCLPTFEERWAFIEKKQKENQERR